MVLHPRQAAARYRVLRRLGAGGMAEVFLAERSEPGRAPVPVALKRVSSHLRNDAAIVGMLEDEVRLGLLCSHDNLVNTLDVGHSDDGPFAVMEYVEGLDLARLRAAMLASNVRFSRAHAVHMCMAICNGLTYLHTLTDASGAPLGIIHRDVTPPNVLLGVRGEVKLCDFGFAKSKAQRTLTEPGLIKGKFGYLSPEATLGHEVDLRADVFAVGILLWEMLTMTRLFQADTDYETIKLIQAGKIPSARAGNAEVDDVLEEIVTKCLARDPRHRFPSAEALHNALAAYADWQELTCDLGALVEQFADRADRDSDLLDRARGLRS
jgi:eukaryotic-like serine/threonine-protein kinase